jgi:DNA-directed RNA polymerase specialized sigma24 family protein
VLAAKEAGTLKPRVPNYIGECFLKIATHLAYKSNFINYTYREEMVSDGIENCITYIDNFNPEKSKNPFAYFTQITYYAFLRRIAKEKRQQQTKYRYMRNIDVHDLITQDHDTGDYGNEFIDYVKKQMDMIDEFDKPDAAKVSNIPKRRPKYLDQKIIDNSLDIE